MKKLMVGALLILAAGTAYAMDGNQWDTCSTADGFMKLENGVLVEPEPMEEEDYTLGQKVETIAIKESKETCQLQELKSTITSFSEVTTYEVYEMTVGGEEPFKQGFLCVRGSSGIPAADTCDESTTKRVDTYTKNPR